MTDQEFATWSADLFTAFPSLWEWLQKASPDPLATQAQWRSTLKPYTLAECKQVVDDWSSGKQKPFEAYERDKVHLLVASSVGLKRDRARRQQELANGNEAYIKRRAGSFDVADVLVDSSMVAAYVELRPLHKKMQSGEISETEYKIAKAEAFERHGMNAKVRATA